MAANLGIGVGVGGVPASQLSASVEAPPPGGTITSDTTLTRADTTTETADYVSG